MATRGIRVAIFCLEEFLFRISQTKEKKRGEIIWTTI